MNPVQFHYMTRAGQAEPPVCQSQYCTVTVVRSSRTLIPPLNTLIILFDVNIISFCWFSMMLFVTMLSPLDFTIPTINTGPLIFLLSDMSGCIDIEQRRFHFLPLSKLRGQRAFLCGKKTQTFFCSFFFLPVHRT